MGEVNITGGTISGTLLRNLLLDSQTRTLAAGLTMTVADSPLQMLDPGGAGRTVVLPAEADSDGLSFLVYNSADAAEDLTFNNDAAGLVGVIGQNEAGLFACNGTTWRVMITNIGAGLAASDVTIVDVGTFFAAAEVEAALQELGATTGAAIIGLLDSGTFTSAATVEAAIAEIYQHILSVQSVLPLPLMNWLDEGAGTLAALAIFSAGASNVPGFTNLSSEGLGLRWNNAATPNPIISQFEKPADMDTSKDAVIHILAIRSATDATDLVTFTVTAFDNVVGAAAGADADFGGASSAMADDVVVQELTLALAAADLAATQGAITLTVQPTDGLLDTIDVTVLGIWIEYSKAVLTS